MQGILVEFKQRGKPTYRKDVIVGLFDDTAHEALLNKIGFQIISELQEGEFDVIMVKSKTKYGKRGEVRLTALQCQITIGMFRGGWNVRLKNIKSMKTSLEQRKSIFNDANRDNAWTQETEKVAELAIQLLREANELI